MYRALIALCAALPAAAQTDTRNFRCQNDLVSLGESPSAVQLKCGAPVLKDRFCQAHEGRVVLTPQGEKRVLGRGGCEWVDEWTYNPGYGQFMTTLRFESGKLAAIRYGERVK
jgi:hypothetical protein